MIEDNNCIVPHIVHSHDVQLDADYIQWLVELKSRYRSAQIKAAVRVNAEKLLFNWQLGRDLVQLKAESRWGEGIVEQLSLDLQAEFPGDKVFSARNLWDMKKWYLYYTTPEAAEKLRQLVAEMPLTQKLAQPVREIDSALALTRRKWPSHSKASRHLSEWPPTTVLRFPMYSLPKSFCVSVCGSWKTNSGSPRN